MSKFFKAGCGCMVLCWVVSLVLGVTLWKWALPRYLPFLDSNVVLLVETAIVDFSSRYPEQVPAVGGNEEWAALLKNREIAGVKLSNFVQQGQLVSLLRVPLTVETKGNYEVNVVAAGTDRIMGTPDDIDSERAREVLEEWEAKKNRDKGAVTK